MDLDIKNGPIVKWYYASMAWMRLEFNSPWVHHFAHLITFDELRGAGTRSPEDFFWLTSEVVFREVLTKWNKDMFYVYILKSEKDGSKYIGETNNLKRRLEEHNNGSAKYTNSKKPFKLIWYCAFIKKLQALKFEKYLKSSSGYAFTNKRLI